MPSASQLSVLMAVWVLALCFPGGLPAQEAPRYKVRLFWRSVPEVLEIAPVLPFRPARAPLLQMSEHQQRAGHMMLRLPVALTVDGGLLRVGRQVATHTRELRIDGPLRMRIPGQTWAEFDGSFRVWVERDELHVEVELQREDYVRAVLTGEGGGMREPEALKALAVAIRSYAFAIGPRHPGEGFHFCDTTHCQDFRLAARHPLLDEVVLETRDELLWKEGKPVPAWYHADSGGQTEDARLIWGNEAPEWLRGVGDNHNPDLPPLAWKASIARTDLARALVAEGFPVSPADEFGVGILLPSGRAHSVTVGNRQIPAATFRFAVGRQLGWNLIRSDWYEVRGDAATWYFLGRGAGHGVGLSQRGAVAMARAGRTYREILSHYFSGAVVARNASDIPWRLQQTGMLHIMSTGGTDIDLFMRVAEQAQKAITNILGMHLQEPVTIRIYPDVDTYRNATGNPGWVAAVTHRTAGGKVQIELQPLDLLLRQNALGSVMAHEMVHALMMQNARISLPLWFQEGMAESLRNVGGLSFIGVDDRAGRRFVDLQEVDDCLTHFESACYLAARQTAAELVVESMRVYGREAVSDWVRRGPPKDDPVLQRVLQQPRQR